MYGHCRLASPGRHPPPRARARGGRVRFDRALAQLRLDLPVQLNADTPILKGYTTSGPRTRSCNDADLGWCNLVARRGRLDGQSIIASGQPRSRMEAVTRGSWSTWHWCLAQGELAGSRARGAWDRVGAGVENAVTPPVVPGGIGCPLLNRRRRFRHRRLCRC
jgi:hypothetical protein